MASGDSNFFRFLITSLVLFLALGISPTDTIQSRLTSKGPEYRNLYVPTHYQSSSNYDPMGLDWLYNITKDFIDLILNEALPKDVVTIKDNNIKVDLGDHVSDVLGQYAYFVGLVLIIVIFALVMLVAGLVFTCCRCCCCGNGHASRSEKKNTCRKITLICFLIIYGALITFGGICALNSNERLRDGFQDFPKDIQVSIDDAAEFLDVTLEQIRILLSVNFNEFIDWINQELDSASGSVQDEINDISTKTKEIFGIAKNFQTIRTDINTIQLFSGKIKTLVTSLAEVSHILNETIDSCPTSFTTGCDELRDTIGSLKFDVEVKNIDEPLTAIQKILIYTDNFEGGETEFDSVKNRLQSKIEYSQKEAESEIKKAGDSMTQNVEQISSEIKKLKDYLPGGTNDDDSPVVKAQDFVDDYDPYLYYAGIAICCILFCIVGLLAVGMICGFGGGSFLNNTGSFFLLCGTTFMFYFTIVLAAFTLIYFLIGVIVQQAVCKSLREPSTSVFFEVVDQYDLSKFGLDTKVSTILASIRKGESAYNVFNLKTKFDLDDVDTYVAQFEAALKKVESLTDGINFEQFKMLNEEQINSLKKITEPDTSKVDSFMEKVKTQLDYVNFGSTIDLLQKKIDDIIAMENPDLNELQENLETAKQDLIDDNGIIVTLNEEFTEVTKNITQLKEDVKLGKDSFENGRDNFISKIDNAQTILVEECPKLISLIVQELGNKTLGVCTEFVKRVKDETKNELGKSKPLGVIFDATLTTVCDKVALQMNSFWFVLLWTMLLFFPTVVISTKLANLYKSEASHKPETMKTPKITKGKTSRKPEDIFSESPIGPNKNANMISGNLNDINLDKWEQYPPHPQAHNPATQVEYTTPPPYFFSKSNMVGPTPRLDANQYDELSKWRQYPETTKSSTRF